MLNDPRQCIFSPFILIGVSLFCIFTSCYKSKLITDDIIAPNWQNSERLNYGVSLNDTLIREVQYTIYFDVNADIPVYILEIITNSEEAESFMRDSSVVCFRRDDFTPIWAWRKVESDLGYTVVATRYTNSRAEIWRETIDGTESGQINYNYPCFDNEMVLTLLRGLRFNASKKYLFNVVIPFTSEKITNIIRYRGKSTINTPSGSFECSKLMLNYRNRVFFIYLENQDPRRLVKFQEKNSNVAMVLLSYD